MVARLVDETVEDGEAPRAAVESDVWLVLPDADRQLRHVFGGDVRRIADDEVERLAGGQRCEEVSLKEANPLEDAMLLGVGASDREGVVADIDRGEVRGGQFFGERDRQAARAGAEVEDAWLRPLLG